MNLISTVAVLTLAASSGKPRVMTPSYPELQEALELRAPMHAYRDISLAQLKRAPIRLRDNQKQATVDVGGRSFDIQLVDGRPFGPKPSMAKLAAHVLVDLGLTEAPGNAPVTVVPFGGLHPADVFPKYTPYGVIQGPKPPAGGAWNRYTRGLVAFGQAITDRRPGQKPTVQHVRHLRSPGQGYAPFEVPDDYEIRPTAKNTPKVASVNREIKLLWRERQQGDIEELASDRASAVSRIVPANPILAAQMPGTQWAADSVFVGSKDPEGAWVKKVTKRGWPERLAKAVVAGERLPPDALYNSLR